MNDDLEKFTPRHQTMESRVATLEAESDTHALQIGDHKGMLRAMDKDVSDAQAAFRAQLAVLNSVRETQSEHTAKLRNIDNQLTGVESRLTSVEGILQKVNVGVQTIVGLLSPAAGEEESGAKSQN
jgi:DNA repair ATPase RecN